MNKSTSYTLVILSIRNDSTLMAKSDLRGHCIFYCNNYELTIQYL